NSQSVGKSQCALPSNVQRRMGLKTRSQMMTYQLNCIQNRWPNLFTRQHANRSHHSTDNRSREQDGDYLRHSCPCSNCGHQLHIAATHTAEREEHKENSSCQHHTRSSAL